VGDKDFSWRCPAEQLRGAGAGETALERAKPAAVEHNARRTRPVFGKPPDRSDRGIVVRRLDPQAKLAGDLVRREIGKTRSQIPRGSNSVGQRIGHSGELCGAIEAPGVGIGL